MIIGTQNIEEFDVYMVATPACIWYLSVVNPDEGFGTRSQQSHESWSWSLLNFCSQLNYLIPIPSMIPDPSFPLNLLPSSLSVLIPSCSSILDYSSWSTFDPGHRSWHFPEPCSSVILHPGSALIPALAPACGPLELFHSGFLLIFILGSTSILNLNFF